MNVKISDAVRRKLDTMNDLMGEVIADLKPDFTQGELTFETKEDQFRFYLCLTSMTDCIMGVKKLRSAASLTDAEVQEMCAESDITVSTAINNMKHNMIGEMLSDVLSQMFTPPPAALRTEPCLSDRTTSAFTVSTTSVVSPSPLSPIPSPRTSARPATARVKHCSGASHT